MTARADLLRELAATPNRLAAAARHAPPPPPGEWTPREVVCHLVAVEAEVWHARLDALWESETEPHWPWVEPGPWDGEGSGTLDGGLQAFATRRAATLERLARLDDAAWQRTGVHATYGRIDVSRLIEIAIDHDREHLASLAG
ncbi:MAG: DinB family protein [Chloroflexi bacterium]|nr:DinB family protein [Chloroflexota bacterium]